MRDAPFPCREPLQEVLGCSLSPSLARNIIGGMDKDKDFAGAPNPVDKGRVRNIAPSEDGIAAWSLEDIAELLEAGNRPDLVAIGESMALVQENMAKLAPADRKAIVAFIKSRPSWPTP